MSLYSISISHHQGIINFGTAVNGLMDDVWLERLQDIQPYKADKSHFRYYQFWGTNEFLQVLSSFMTKYFKPWNSEISVENVCKFDELNELQYIVLSYRGSSCSFSTELY